jgi:CheY-like chemotaxis protein
MATVLFVDDEEGPLRWHCIMLEKTGGHTVAFYRFAEDAMRHIESVAQAEAPDIIILDINMPADGRYANDPTNTDGRRTGIRLLRDLCRVFKSIPPIVILTQLRNPEILAEAREVYDKVVILDKLAASPRALLDEVNILLESAQKAE